MIVLEEGEILCPECEGLRRIEVKFEENSQDKIQIPVVKIPCPKCDGTGKLTWIENIFGKQETMIDRLNLNSSEVPEGFLPCDGGNLDSLVYNELFNTLKSRYE